jgi:hypothetical protein
MFSARIYTKETKTLEGVFLTLTESNVYHWPIAAVPRPARVWRTLLVTRLELGVGVAGDDV